MISAKDASRLVDLVFNYSVPRTLEAKATIVLAVLDFLSTCNNIEISEYCNNCGCRENEFEDP